MFQNADEAKKFIADEDVKFIDVRFCDLPGVMQHFTIPAKAFDPAEELAFDGSSIRGFQAIHESDMALRADLSTARVDPFRRDKTVNVNFFIHEKDAPTTIGLTTFKQSAVTVPLTVYGKFAAHLVQGTLVTCEIPSAGYTARFVVPSEPSALLADLTTIPIELLRGE